MIEYIYTHANMYAIFYLQKDRSLGKVISRHLNYEEHKGDIS